MATLVICAMISAIFFAVYILKIREDTIKQDKTSEHPSPSPLPSPSPRPIATCVVRTYVNDTEVSGAYVRVTFPGSTMGGYDMLPPQSGESPLTITFDYGRGFHVRAYYSENGLNCTGYKWVTWFSSYPDHGDIIVNLRVVEKD